MESSTETTIPPPESCDVLFSFDTTGSMYPCIREVRRNLKDMVRRLFEEIPGIRISVVAHGDYCDEEKTYLMKSLDFTNDAGKIVEFVNSVGNTYGGDYPEAYEYVLKKVQELSWESSKMRAMVVIADAYPHGVNQNPGRLDWREESKELAKMGVNIYSVQCLNNGNGKCRTFYKQMAALTNGYHLYMDQFSYIKDILMAICYQQMSNARLEHFEQEINDRMGGMTNSMRRMFDTMMRRKPREPDSDDDTKEDDGTIHPSPAAKFQILTVDEKCSIKGFVIDMGLTFKAGRGFYEFTKPEIISMKKQIVLMEKGSGKLFEGAAARRLAGIPTGDTKRRIRPTDVEDYTVFIQSTSYNRKLMANTRFLYEVSDFDIRA